MAQYEMNLRDYWVIVRRRRVIIIASTVLVMLFSYWFARQKVPVYQATAAVKFEQSTSLSGLLVEVLSYSSADNIETQATLIKSYPVLEEVARRLGRLPQSAKGEPLRESKAYGATLDAIAAKLRTNRVPSTSILEIIATSANAVEARDLANTVAEVYRDFSKSNRNARITEARKFIEAQLREVEARVKRAEEELWAFRDANRIISPGAESTVLLSLFTQVRADIEKARQQRIELEQAQLRLSRHDPASLNERFYIDTTNPAIQKLAATQSELMLERNNLALEVTDKHPRLQALDDRLREVRAEMRREVAAQVALLRSREEILNRQMGDLMQKNREVPAIELNLQRLQRDAKVNDDLLTLLKTKHQEALIKESEGVEEVTFVRPAAEPGAPVASDTLNTVLVGALLGLLLGLVLAFVQETLDTSIGTIEDVESYLEVPVLGIVPHIDPREMLQRLIERRPALAQMEADVLQSHALLITHFDPKSPVAEAYRTLRTNIQFQRMERTGKVLVVTSPTLQEGKTTTIVNLALTMAQNGQKTLLVGANLRRPSIYRFFGIEREPGLSDVLVGNARWRDCIRTVADILMGRFEMEDIMASPGLDNLHIIEAGPIPANPSELLSTPAMAEFLKAVSAEYDIVLIDTPPVLPVTDSAIVAGQADGVLLVYQAGKVGRLVLKRAKAHLESARGKVWGVVLNDVQTELSGYAYTQYYTHYYGEEQRAEPSRGAAGRWWDALRGKLGRPAASESRTVDEVVPGTPMSPAGRAADRGRRASTFWLGVIGLGLVIGGAGGVMAWRMGWIPGRDLRPLHQLRERLTGAPPPSERPAPRSAPVPPSAPPRPAPTSGSSAPSSTRSASTPSPSTPPASMLGASTSSLATPLPSTAAPLAGSAATPPSSAPATSAAMPSAPGVPDAPTAGGPTETRAQPPGGVTAAPPRATFTPFTARPTVGAVTSGAKTQAPAPPRFAIEFGPFQNAADAERIERQLTQAGYPTVRFRQQTGAAVYAVLIERVPTSRDAQSVIATLREQGHGEATVAGTDPITLRVGEPAPLRSAIELAERLRAAGHHVRVAARPGEAVTFVIRHGNFASRHDADARSRELVRQSLPNQVVQVR